MSKRRPSPGLIAAILAVHTVVAAVTWRDLNRRPAGQIRGSRRLWKMATGVNSAASLAYWVIGRKAG